MLRYGLDKRKRLGSLRNNDLWWPGSRATVLMGKPGKRMPVGGLAWLLHGRRAGLDKWVQRYEVTEVVVRHEQWTVGNLGFASKQ